MKKRIVRGKKWMLASVVVQFACGDVVLAPDAGMDIDAEPPAEDVTPPETTLTMVPDELTSLAVARFHFESSEAASVFRCRLDEGSDEPCTAPYEVSVAEGLRRFRVHAVDAAGNADPSAAEHMWRVDLTPPETTLTAAPPGIDNATDVVFEFESSEPMSTFECALGNRAYAPCTSPHAVAIPVGGPQTFRVRAMDAAGNVEPEPAAHDWIVDLSVPDTTIDTGPSGPVSSRSATFTFSSPLAGAFECALGQAGFAPCTSPRSFASLEEGCYELRVRAVNSAGTMDPTPAVRQWCVDVTAPVTALVQTPDAFSSSSSGVFEFVAGEAGITFACALDSAAPLACQPPLVLNRLQEGTHELRIQATDPAGNVESMPVTHRWTVDTMAPDTSILSGPAAVSNASSATLDMGASEDGVTYACQLDSGVFEPCSAPVRYDNLGEGTHVVAIRATDRAGNVDPTPALHRWTVDMSLPDTSITGGHTGAVSTRDASFSLTASEPGCSFQCRLDGGNWARCESPHVLSGLGEGAHTLEVRAVDAAGNTDGSPAVRTWIVDTAPPDTSITAGPSGPVSATAARFDFVGSEAGSSFQCKLDGGAFAPCSSPQAYTSLAQGSHTFEVRAIDAAGNADPTPALRSFGVDTVACDTTIGSAPAGAVSSTSATIEVASSEPGSSFQCQLDGADWQACTSSYTYTGLSERVHTVAARCMDAAGNIDPSPATHAWSVDLTAPDTAVSGTSGLINWNTAFFEFSSGDTGARFECKLDDGAWQACASPAFHGGLSEGAHTFQVRAIDSAGNADASPASRTWTVDTIAPGVIITDAYNLVHVPLVTTKRVIYFTASEPATFLCRLGDGNFEPCTSPVEYITYWIGSFRASFQAIDAAGNVGPVVDHYWSTP